MAKPPITISEELLQSNRIDNTLENGIDVCNEILLKYMPDMTFEDTISKIRTPRIVTASAICAFALRQEGYTLTMIGDILNRHHATIIHLLNTFSQKFKSEQDIAKEFLLIEIRKVENNLTELKKQLKSIDKIKYGKN